MIWLENCWIGVKQQPLSILWRSVLVVEETGVPGENNRPASSHRQTLSHNVHSIGTCRLKSLIDVLICKLHYGFGGIRHLTPLRQVSLSMFSLNSNNLYVQKLDRMRIIHRHLFHSKNICPLLFLSKEEEGAYHMFF